MRQLLQTPFSKAYSISYKFNFLFCIQMNAYFGEHPLFPKKKDKKKVKKEKIKIRPSTDQYAETQSANVEQPLDSEKAESRKEEPRSDVEKIAPIPKHSKSVIPVIPEKKKTNYR